MKGAILIHAPFVIHYSLGMAATGLWSIKDISQISVLVLANERFLFACN
jgi:hypothetical protein